jgi:hypothetical protein
VLEIGKNRENALLKEISNLDLKKKILHIFSQINVFVGFYNKTCVKLSSKSTFFHQNDLSVFEPSWN